MSCLFLGLSSFVHLPSTTHSSTLPPSVISFLFITGLTPHCMPPTNFLPILCSTFLLNSTLIAYFSNLFSSSPLGPSHSSPHINKFWILLDGSNTFLIFPRLFNPSALGGLLSHPIGIHAHQPFFHEQNLDLKWDLFQKKITRTLSELSFSVVERIRVIHRKFNNLSLLYLIKQKINGTSPLIVQCLQTLKCGLNPNHWL